MTEGYTGADLFADALSEYGVDYLFGNPGTTELPIVRALADRDIEYVLGLHEDVAVGMAAGYASARRYHTHSADADADDASAEANDSPGGHGGPPDGINPLGVANLHVTPGLAHGLGNTFAADYSGAPILVTVGNHERDFRTEEPILTGDLVGTVEPHVKWADEVLDVRAVPRMVSRAVRTALTPPTGPVFLALPLDVVRAETDADPAPLGQIPSAGRGDPTQVGRAADIVAEADDVVLVLGDGVARAGAVPEAVAFAEASGARVHAEIQASEANFPQDHSQWVSHIPPDEDLASLILEAPTLVLVGTSTNTTLLRHEEPLVPDDAAVVSISQEPREVGKNYGADAGVIGDPRLVLEELAGIVRQRLDEDERQGRLRKVEAIADALADTVREMGEDEDDGSQFPSKADTVDALYEAAPDALLVDEGVTAKYALLTRWPFQSEGLIGSKSGGLGYGVPACLGVALAARQRAAETGDQQRTVVGHFGDGAYCYYPHAIHAAARLGLDVTLVVQNNRRYRILEENASKLFGGDPDEQNLPGMALSPTVDLVKSAESFGASGHRVDRPGDLEATFEAAIDEDGPTLVDVWVHD